MHATLLQHRRALLKAILAASGAATLSGCASMTALGETEEERAYRLASEAYIYAYPLIYFAKLRYSRMVKGDPVTGEKHRWGAWAHRNKVVTPEIQGAPQVDTFYSNGWLDLGHEPFLLRIPKMDGRYWSVQCCDLFGTTYGMANRRTFKEGALIALTGPDWNGVLPGDVTQVYRSQMRQSFILLRMFFASEADRPQAAALQQGFALYPLSYHGREQDWQPRATVPLQPVNSGDTLADFKTLQLMWQECPPPAADTEFCERYADIGLARGITDGFASLSAETRRGLERAEADMRKKMLSVTQNIPGARTVNGWAVPKRSIGLYDDRDHLYRAGVALLGTVATPAAENIYYVAQHEMDGKRFHGDHHYMVQYSKAQMPQATAFWSLHAYRYENYTLIPNPINRYSIGDRTQGLVFNDDGGLTLYVQADDPGGARSANWLPVMKGKEFFLMTRAYEPQGSMKDLSWPGPVITRVE